MASVVSVPERVAAIFAEDGDGAMPRWALMGALAEAVREGRVSRGFFREALDLPFTEAEEFLATRNVAYDFTEEELDRQADLVASRRR